MDEHDMLLGQRKQTHTKIANLYRLQAQLLQVNDSGQIGVEGRFVGSVQIQV